MEVSEITSGNLTKRYGSYFVEPFNDTEMIVSGDYER